MKVTYWYGTQETLEFARTPNGRLQIEAAGWDPDMMHLDEAAAYTPDRGVLRKRAPDIQEIKLKMLGPDPEEPEQVKFPTNHEDVLVWHKGEWWLGHHDEQEQEWFLRHVDGLLLCLTSSDVKHWRPLPPEPKA